MVTTVTYKGHSMTNTPTDDEITLLARANGLFLDPAFYEGIRTNLHLLRHYAQRVEETDLPDTTPPAYEYTP